MMKITGLSHLFKWENLHNWWLTKYFFAPLYVPETLTAPKRLVPHGQKGMMLTHAHDAPCAGHHDIKATYETLKQVAYWPGMQQDVAEYVKGCLVCCQFQLANPNH